MKSLQSLKVRKIGSRFNLLMALMCLMITKNSSAMMTDEVLVKETRYSNVSIHTIDVNAIGKVVLKKGSETKVEVETDESSQPKIITTCKSGKLKIYTKKGEKSADVIVYITLKEDVKCLLHAVGLIASEGVLDLKQVTIDAKAVGEIALSLTSTRFELKGEAIGKVRLTGSATTSDITAKSVGVYDASELMSKDVHVVMSAVNELKIYATGQLSLAVKACSVVFVKGDPIIDKSSSDQTLTIQKI